jgi:hypothetical protein
VTHVGCMIWIALLLGLTLAGAAATAGRGHASSWVGLGSGLAAWLALLAGYASAMSIVDWRRARRQPDLIGVPTWVVPAVWVVFVAATLVCAALLRRLYAA